MAWYVSESNGLQTGRPGPSLAALVSHLSPLIMSDPCGKTGLASLAGSSQKETARQESEARKEPGQ